MRTAIVRCLKGRHSGYSSKNRQRVDDTVNDCDVAHVLTQAHSNNRFAKNVFFVLLHS